MRALVTGAQGFIGRYLAADLVARGAEVVGLGRSGRLASFTHSLGWNGQHIRAPLPTAISDALAGTDYRYRQVDLTDPLAVHALLDAEKIDVIYHLAGALRDSPIDQLVRSNIVALQVLIDAASRQDKGPRIVYASSGSVVGPVPEDRLPIRADPRDIIHPVDQYAITKRAAEDLAALARKQHGLQIVTGRVFAVVGPGQEERHLCGHLARQFAERKAGLSQEPISVGPLDTTRDFCDVRDVAAGLALLGTVDDPPDLCNVASGIETPTDAVFTTLARLSDDPSKIAPTLPGRKTELGRSVADISQLRALGYAPKISVAQSLSDLLDYYLHDVAAHG